MVFWCASCPPGMGDIEGNIMKILVFTTEIYLLGGAEKLAVELVEGLNSQPGVQADLLVMGPEDISGTEKTKHRLLTNGVRSVRFLGRIPGTRGRNLLKFIFKLRRILRLGGYDFIETSMTGPTTLACWATLGLRTRLVAGIHMIYHRDHQNNWSYRFLRFSAQFNRNVEFYAISKQAMGHWLKYASIEPERIRVIYNSIAADHFKSTRNGLRPERIFDIGSSERKALFVGRLCQLKGLDTLVYGLGPILREERIHLFVVGGPDATSTETSDPEDTKLVERLTRQIADSAWADRVHFLGFRDDIPKLMHSVDVLVHPTRTEGFGLVLVEALAAGLPIVTTDVGGIPEVLAGTTSIMVPPDDPVALRHAVREVLHRTSQEAARCRTVDRQRAEFFRPERRIADMLALFCALSAPRVKGACVNE